jgi:MHS family proline/betaine transporter-like MFS transporter
LSTPGGRYRGLQGPRLTELAPAKRSERSPIVETLREHWRLVLRLAVLSVFNGVSFYVMFLYVASWQQTADGKHSACCQTVSVVSRF